MTKQLCKSITSHFKRARLCKSIAWQNALRFFSPKMQVRETARVQSFIYFSHQQQTANVYKWIVWATDHELFVDLTPKHLRNVDQIRVQTTIQGIFIIMPRKMRVYNFLSLRHPFIIWLEFTLWKRIYAYIRATCRQYVTKYPLLSTIYNIPMRRCAAH